MLNAERITLRHSGLEFSAWTKGHGPLVLLVHGFPDIPQTFEHQMSALAAAGFRAVAVTLRGYEASSLPLDGSFHVRRLVDDLLGHVEALGVTSAHLVGHDWGASIAYAAAVAAPSSWCSLTMLAVPPPARFAEIVATDPDQQLRSDYINFFLADPAGSDSMVSDEAGGYLRSLWHRWSPRWAFSEREFSPAQQALSAPGISTAALSYYRQAMDIASEIGRESVALYMHPVTIPVLALAGADDGCISAEVFCRAFRDTDFPDGLELGVVDGAGHFLHRERPEAVNKRLVDFLFRHATHCSVERP